MRTGETTSVALVEESIAIADAHDAGVGTFLDRFCEAALVRAAAADAELAAGTDLGPLHGIPLGIKDIITTAEGETTAHCLVLYRAWGRGDAPVVARLRAAGGIVMGKLTTMEFAIGAPDSEKPFPIPRNPWDLDAWAGGSSWLADPSSGPSSRVSVMDAWEVRAGLLGRHDVGQPESRPGPARCWSLLPTPGCAGATFPS